MMIRFDLHRFGTFCLFGLLYKTAGGRNASRCPELTMSAVIYLSDYSVPSSLFDPARVSVRQICKCLLRVCVRALFYSVAIVVVAVVVVVVHIILDLRASLY